MNVLDLRHVLDVVRMKPGFMDMARLICAGR